MILSQENNAAWHDTLLSLHNGDENALAAIFKQYHTALLYFAQQYIRDRQAAEDIVTESFIAVWRKRKDFASMPSLKSFLYKTVRNACIDQIRQNNRHAHLHKEIEYLAERTEEFMNSRIIKAELMQKLLNDIEQLPPMRREIFKMIYIDGLSTVETAAALRISVDTVRVQKARAIHALRGFFKDHV
jgi:RNA polymerase sigma-70 factor (family 1)